MLATLTTIWLLHAAALLTPGANTLLISHLSASGRSRTAAIAALGISAGAALWSSAAVLGVNAVFVAFPLVRLLLQALGACYLLYLGWRVWHSAPSSPQPQRSADASLAAFRLGLLTNLSNPKSALFFGSVFAAALPAHPGSALLVFSVALIVANALCWHLLLAYLFSRPVVRVRYAQGAGLFARLAGSIVGAAGLGLLVASLREAQRFHGASAT